MRLHHNWCTEARRGSARLLRILSQALERWDEGTLAKSGRAGLFRIEQGEQKLFAREYHIRAKRAARQKLQGEQLDISFPVRGRPKKQRVLERCGQMRLNLLPPGNRVCGQQDLGTERAATHSDDFDDALQMTFPVRPYTDDELMAEFERLFPCDAC
jgi:hypothetical protein